MTDAPVTDDFWLDACKEAEYQRETWPDDAVKEPADWSWTLGHIVGKAIHDPTQDVTKLRHRLRAGAALLSNWDRAAECPPENPESAAPSIADGTVSQGLVDGLDYLIGKYGYAGVVSALGELREGVQ